MRLRVLRSQDSSFKRKLLSHRRRGVEGSDELVRLLLIDRTRKRKIREMFKQFYGIQLSAFIAYPLTPIAEKEIIVWWQRSLSKAMYYNSTQAWCSVCSAEMTTSKKKASYMVLAIHWDTA